MGAPKRNRRTFDKPKDIWNLARINADNALIKEFGLKNMSELWKAQYELSRLRGNVRGLLAGTGTADVEKRILGRLVRLGIVQDGATLEKLLDLNEQAFLSRRLQTIVFKKGLARSVRQARQLITHGFIAINGHKVDRPGYMVRADEEQGIGYFKHIEIAPVAASQRQAETPAQPAEPSAGNEPAPVPAAEPAVAQAQ
jgi:small subunit ribosomal protein S4